MLKYSVGLDISSKDIHCCISAIDHLQRVTIKSSRRVANSAVGFRNLEAWIEKNRRDREIPLSVCMEATGVYYENCALYLSQKGYQVSVILPNYAKKYLQASGQKSKTDSIDARGLAQMGAEKSLPVWGAMDRETYGLRQLTRYYEQVQEDLTSLKNQLHALQNGMYREKSVIAMIDRRIRLMEKQREEILRKIEEHLAANPELADMSRRMQTVKGVGLITVATLLAETNRFRLFENQKQLVSYSGYDPVDNQSGSHVGRTRISKKGNSHIRRMMFMPSLSVVKHGVRPFKDLFDRTLERHGQKMKSYVAVQKKLLTTLYALCKNGADFDEEHVWKGQERKGVENGDIGDKKSVPIDESALHEVNRTGEPAPVSST